MKDKKYLIIDSRPYGLFSIFLHTIDCIKWAEDNNYVPYIRWNSGRVDINLNREGAEEATLKGDPKYVKDKYNFLTKEKIQNNSRPCLYAEVENENAWNYYFEEINNIEENDVFSSEHKISDIFLCGELDFDLENKFLIRNMHSYDSLKLWSIAGTEKEKNHRLEVFKIIQKYIKVKKDILSRVEKFKQLKMNEELLIGVHVRGTDKKTEYPFKQLTFKHYIDKINDIVSKNPDKSYKIYVASDNNESIIKMADYYGKKNIICHPSIRVSSHSSKIPIHLKNDIDKRKHGEETLIEMLLLSKCNHIIGTDSNFTAVASYYNTEANLIYLNRIYGE